MKKSIRTPTEWAKAFIKPATGKFKDQKVNPDDIQFQVFSKNEIEEAFNKVIIKRYIEHIKKEKR